MKGVSRRNIHGGPASRVMLRGVVVAVGAIALAVPSAVGVARADAAAQNQCSYSVNYFCSVTTTSEKRSPDKSVTATANYARETSSQQPPKIVGYASGPFNLFYTTVTGTADTVYQTFSRRSTEIYCAFRPPAGVAVGCNYTP